MFAVKTGLLYSRRLIEKSIDADGKCPVSGEELTVDDLVPVKGACVLLNPATLLCGRWCGRRAPLTVPRSLYRPPVYLVL